MGVEFKKTGIIDTSCESIGKNLLVPQISDSKWSNWNANSTWTSINTREKIVDSNGKTWAHIIQTTSDGYGGYTCTPVNNEIIINPNKKYTISVLAKSGASANSQIILWNHWRSTEGGANLSQQSTKINLTSIPTRVSCVWTPNAGSTSYTVDRINLMIGTHGLADNEIYYTDVKFEEGEIATPWLPNESEIGYPGNLHGFVEYGIQMSVYPNHIITTEFIEY